MSDDSTLNQEIIIGPDEEITPEKKIILLRQWKNKVQNELDVYIIEKNKIVAEYQRIKGNMDKILGKRMRRMKKYDVLMTSRKKVLIDIVKEINIATNLTNSQNTTQESGNNSNSCKPLE